MLAPSDIIWHKEADVVVIGYGMAGAVAAITARDCSASVMILEKQAAGSHWSNSSLSAGLVVRPADIGGGIAYMKALCEARGSALLPENDTREGCRYGGGADRGNGCAMRGPAPWTDAETIRVWAEYAFQNKDWIESLGGQVRLVRRGGQHPQLPGAGSIEIWEYRGKGLPMMQLMYEQVASRKVEVLYQTRAVRLLTDADGKVIGVKTVVGGGQEEMNIRAGKAVILCTGGFEDNEEMKLQYLRVYPMYFTGGLGNTGDGIAMAQEAGADLWHMNCASAGLSAKFPDFPLAFPVDLSAKLFADHGASDRRGKGGPGFIIVDKYGQRYTNENFPSHAGWYQVASFDATRLEYPRVPSFFVFDQRRMGLGRLVRTFGAAGPHQLYRWSADNAAELKRGWIISGESAGELADRIGIPRSNLERTVRSWNDACARGRDPDFGRNGSDLVPLDSPPFYAVKLFPGGANTLGGPRRNARAQVLNPFGEPIPRLYAAGECGSVYGMLYPAAGGNLAECIAFGRIAAENAVAEAAMEGNGG
ncbi:MAG: FAD-dependent oxidoreductase [Chloroflexi bacterium]|nr:FAD-dependent oxidoreductase [Chloroflexota bacterium]